MQQPNHRIKLARAREVAAIGRYPRTWHAIVGAMPPRLISQCTSKQIALFADIMRGQFEIGHSAGYKDATD
jgi:hypothetical protein